MESGGAEKHCNSSGGVLGSDTNMCHKAPLVVCHSFFFYFYDYNIIILLYVNDGWNKCLESWWTSAKTGQTVWHLLGQGHGMHWLHNVPLQDSPGTLEVPVGHSWYSQSHSYTSVYFASIRLQVLADFLNLILLNSADHTTVCDCAFHTHQSKSVNISALFLWSPHHPWLMVTVLLHCLAS